MSLLAFGTASFLPRYTPAQLAAHERMKSIRAKHKAQMLARLEAQREAERRREEAEKAALEEARQREAYKAEMARRRFEAAAVLSAVRAPESRPYGGLQVAKVRFDDALARVSEAYGIPEDVILSPCRMIAVVTARTHFTAILAKENPYSSLPSLGRALGRDHTTILHSLNRWNAATGENVKMVGVGRRVGQRTLQFKHVPERAS